MTIPTARPRDIVNVSQSRSWAARHFSGTVGRITSMETDILETTTDNPESGSPFGCYARPINNARVTNRTLNIVHHM